ncbi:MAG: RNA polymerase subunit sigma-24 [Syntrophales bacterium]
MSSWRKLGNILFLSLLVMFCFLLGKHAMGDEYKDATLLAMQGGEISNEEALKLEQQLGQNVNDLAARAKLLGYYQLESFKSKDARKARQRHILWVIQNCPGCGIASTPYSWLDPMLDGEVYYEAKALWLKQVESHKESTAIIGNAAKFFILHDQDAAEDLLKRAKALDPRNPEWPKRLGEIYSLGMSRKPAESRKEAGAKSLEQMEETLSLTIDDNNKFYLLDELSTVAFEAGDSSKASKYASQLLQKAPQYKKDWNYGNAIHKGNLILGRVALASGKLEEAKDYLLKAGKTPGSPQLDSFGPNMTLAKELLEKGERKVVIEYFRECGNFWQSGNDKLMNWMAIVNQGGMPNFGGNLDY